MSQSLYTSMGGISAAQTSLNVISNNIANINTTAFKSSAVNFSEVYSTTLSSGTASTDTTGGTNPKQVGLGVEVGSISRNFTSGTWVATGKTTDLMIEGTGFFTVKNSAGEIFYTRAGDFSFDSKGDLVTSGGYKVVGTNTILGTSSSADPVHIPQSIVADVSANQNFYNSDITKLNNCSLTNGKFNLSVNGKPAKDIYVDTGSYKTMQDLAKSIQSQIGAASAAANTAAAAATTAVAAAATAHASNPAQVAAAAAATAAAASQTAAAALPSGTPAEQAAKLAALNTASTQVTTAMAAVKAADPSLATSADAASAQTTAAVTEANEDANVTVKCDASTNGTIQFCVDGTVAKTLTFSNASKNQSNFLAKTGFINAPEVNNTYTSNILDYKVDVKQVTSVEKGTSISGYSIGNDGSIAATYSNGASLTTELGPDGATYQFKYTTAEGIVINGSKANVDNNVAKPANFQIQLASIANNEGLLSKGSNLFTAGPNSGDIIYSVGSAMGLGAIKSGGLEASNVDLSSEFSSMILAQRAVQANSRVFSTTSQIMNIIVQMGQ